MKLIICAIWDKKAKEYQTPFVMPNKATAIRNFMQAVKDEKSMLNQFAEDYRLDYLGEVSLTTGYLIDNNVEDIKGPDYSEDYQKEVLMEAANVVIKK